MMPPSIFSFINWYPVSYRDCRPTTKLRFFSFANSLRLITLLYLGISTNKGFSINTCRPALTATSRYRGRNGGGVAKSTTSQLSIILVSIKTHKFFGIGNFYLTSIGFFLDFHRPHSTGPHKLRPNATNFTAVEVFSASWAALVPLPPQPTRPILISSDFLLGSHTKRIHRQPGQQSTSRKGRSTRFNEIPSSAIYFFLIHNTVFH